MKRRQASTDPAATADFDAVRRCFEAYGADVEKWPTDMRARYGALATAAEMSAARDEATSLDGFLNAATAPRMSADLKNRIAAQYVSPPPAAAADFSTLLSFLRPLPAGALAGLGALGFAVGVLTNTSQAALAPEYEAYAYVQEATLLAMADDEEAALWDVD